MMHKDLKAGIQQHFKPIFQKYDKDMNSTLEKQELRMMLADNLGVTPQQITQDQLDWHFGKIDHDNDGKITFDEYFSHFFGDRLIKAKKQLDNEDELIDKEEFKKLMKDTFAPLKIQITQEMVDWNFAQIDTDNSGRISFDQYLKFIKKYN